MDGAKCSREGRIREDERSDMQHKPRERINQWWTWRPSTSSQPPLPSLRISSSKPCKTNPSSLCGGDCTWKSGWSDSPGTEPDSLLNRYTSSSPSLGGESVIASGSGSEKGDAARVGGKERNSTDGESAV